MLEKSDVNSLQSESGEEKRSRKNNGRLKHRLQLGMIEEVKVIDNGISFERLNLFGLEYKFMENI